MYAGHVNDLEAHASAGVSRLYALGGFGSPNHIADGLASADAQGNWEEVAGGFQNVTVTQTMLSVGSDCAAALWIGGSAMDVGSQGVPSHGVARLVPCIADFNRDRAIDFFDFDDFVACFEGTGCPAGLSADVNCDGFVDFFDYDLFEAEFTAGGCE